MTSRCHHRPLALAVLLATLASPLSALAQATPAAPTAPTDRAEQLYSDAKRLASEGKYPAACPMFEESQRLEPAIGTQFNLADCYEKTGRLATALGLFREVARVAQMSGKQERQRAAQERVTALERIAPRLRIKPPPSPAASETTTRVDGKLVEGEELVQGFAVDPGEHVVKVDAAGYRPWSTTVTAAIAAADEQAQVLEVAVPALEPTAPVVFAPAEPPPAPYTPPSKLRPIGFAMMGVGVIGIGAGAIFGFSAISRKNDANCNGTDCSGSPTGSGDTLRDAQSAATLSTICFIGGGLLAAGGLVLFIVAPRGSTTRASASMTPGGAGMTLERTF